MSKLTLRSLSVGILAMEIAHRNKWSGTNISGHPVPGITDTGHRGVLPEPYWTAARDAVYAIYHHETPIAWRIESETDHDVWVIPEHRYSQTTSTFRNKIVEALGINGAEIIWI